MAFATLRRHDVAPLFRTQKQDGKRDPWLWRDVRPGFGAAVGWWVLLLASGANPFEFRDRRALAGYARHSRPQHRLADAVGRRGQRPRMAEHRRSPERRRGRLRLS